jgi:hypothetical protein
MAADASHRFTGSETGPFFIVGCPRSGTTLLQRMLDAHPDVAVAPETFFIRRFWKRRTEYGDLQRDAAFERLLRDIMAIPEFEEMELAPDAFAAAARDADRSYAALFRLLLRQFAEQRAAQVVGEKTPNHVLYLPTLHDFFPDARFIHLVRDPRAVVNSWRSVPWSSGRAWRDAEVWVEYVAAGRAAGSLLGEALQVVHFETLVRAPEQTLRRVCAHLALDYDPAMQAFHERTPQTVNVEREPWKANATQPIDPSVAEQWRSALTPQQVTEVEAVAAEEMLHWGYAPEQPMWRRAVTQAALPLRRVGWKLELVFDKWRGAA